MSVFIKLLVKYKKYVIYLLVLLLTIMLCIWNYNLRSELKEVKSQNSHILAVYDTVYVDKPFVVDKPYEKVEEPVKVVIFNKPEDSIKIDNQVVSINLDTEMVRFSTINSDSIFSDNYYPLNLTSYDYIYTEGKLTKKRIPLLRRFKPYVGISYRPFNNLYDLSGGISFKTKKFNYKLGLNVSYYPKFSSRVNLDLELAIIYNF